MMHIPEAIGISVFEMALYQKNLALLQEKCSSKEFQKLFPEPFGDKDLFVYTTSYRYESEHPVLLYAGVNENTESMAIYFPSYLDGRELQTMLYHLRGFHYYETIVIFCHKTNFEEVKADMIAWFPKKTRKKKIIMVTLEDDAQ